jgi:hypothetical protein
VTAEGIERPQQLALLLGYRSMSLQGFLIARPMPGDRIPDSVGTMPERLRSFLLTAAPQDTRSMQIPEPVRATG